MMGESEGRKKRKEIEEVEEEANEYLNELVEAKMEQAELRFTSSKHWMFIEENEENTNSD